MALYEKYVWNSTTNTWDLVVNPDSLFYIAGTGTTAGTWLGSHNRIGEYYDGLTIAYKIPISGASTTTLNINGLGAITVRRNTGNLTTHLPANTVVILTYTIISGTPYWVWADYNANSSLMTQAAIDTGIETTAREINALLLRNNFYLKSETDTLLNGKENTITKGSTAQYFRGDMSLETFPTSLPASDVYAWAKESTKPSYNLGEITETATYKRVSESEKNTWNGKQNALGFTPENIANKRTSVRVSGADNTSYVSELGVKTYVDGLIGSVYRPSGDWNAATNSPTLANSTPANAGKVYRVSVAGTQFGFTFAVGDKLAFNESGVISKWDNVDDVVTVNGKAGTVVLTTDDINEGLNLYVLQSEKNTWNGKEPSITGAATTITSSNLTANRALISNGSGKVGVSPVTATELGYLDGLTSNIQTQLGGKFNNPGGSTSQYIRGNGSLATFPTIPTTLSQLSDVTQLSPSTGQVLTYNGSGWANANKPTYNLDEISEGTTYKRVTQSEKNTWNGKFDTPSGSTSQYVRGNGSLATFPSIPSSLGNLSDVDLTLPSPANGHILTFNGASWKASPKPSYNLDDIGDGSTYKRVTQSEKNTWNNKLSSQNLELLRSRSGTNALTIHSNTAITGLGLQLSQGDTIMFEVLHASGVSTSTPKVITATVGSSANSTSHERSITYTTWSGSEQRVYSMSVALISNQLIFGNANYMRMYKSGSDMIISNSSWTPYIGKVWKVVGV